LHSLLETAHTRARPQTLASALEFQALFGAFQRFAQLGAHLSCDSLLESEHGWRVVVSSTTRCSANFVLPAEAEWSTKKVRVANVNAVLFRDTYIRVRVQRSVR
jgi:hypothetical protein